MKIAYFVNQYPKVSHSFIRREILQLEKDGYEIERYALQANRDELVDPLDLAEYEKTRFVFYQSKIWIILIFFRTLLRAPVKFVKTLLFTLKISHHSDRGLLIHLAYLVEACVIVHWQRQHRIEHIHAHFGTNSATVVMLARLLGGAPYSFTVHGPREFDFPEFIALKEKIIYSKFVVAISHFGRSQLYRWVPQEYWHKVKIIHCALDSKFFDESRPLPDTSEKSLLYVGRLCPEKGAMLLLQALRQVIDQGYRCQLTLAGDGPIRVMLEQQIKALKLEDVVSISGWISSDTVKQYILDSQLLILPSFAEGLPVVLMEAMALKRPVITTYIAGIPELVKNGENGWLIPASNLEALTAAIVQAVQAPHEQLQRMGEAGHQAVFKEHNITTQALKLGQLFRQS